MECGDGRASWCNAVIGVGHARLGSWMLTSVPPSRVSFWPSNDKLLQRVNEDNMVKMKTRHSPSFCIQCSQGASSAGDRTSKRKSSRLDVRPRQRKLSSLVFHRHSASLHSASITWFPSRFPHGIGSQHNYQYAMDTLGHNSTAGLRTIASFPYASRCRRIPCMLKLHLPICRLLRVSAGDISEDMVCTWFNGMLVLDVD